jgi:hypothetical protein
VLEFLSREQMLAVFVHENMPVKAAKMLSRR